MNVKDRLMAFIVYKGITVSEFERVSGLSNSYVNKMKTSIGKLGMMNIQRAFPELNTNWLLTGEGEMLNPPHTDTVQSQYGGDHNKQSLTVNPNASDKFIELLKKKDEQIDRLITMLEKKMET